MLPSGLLTDLTLLDLTWSDDAFVRLFIKTDIFDGTVVYEIDQIRFAAVPEPTAMMLFISGALCIARVRGRRRARSLL